MHSDETVKHTLKILRYKLIALEYRNSSNKRPWRIIFILKL